MVGLLQRDLRQGTVKRHMLCLISSFSLSLWWHVGLLRLLVRTSTLWRVLVWAGGKVVVCNTPPKDLNVDSPFLSMTRDSTGNSDSLRFRHLPS